MEWTIVILFVAALVLLIISFIKSGQSTKNTEKQIEEISFTFTEELNRIQNQIRNMELNAEITITEANLLSLYSKHRDVLREALDLCKRGYSYESIGSKLQLTPAEVEQLLTPYIKQKIEGRTVPNEI